MLVGMLSWLAWAVLVKLPEVNVLGLGAMITGDPKKPSLLMDHPNWPMVDPLFIALPLSILTAIGVSLMTRPHAPAAVEVTQEQDALAAR